MRTGIVLAKEGGALAKMLPIFNIFAGGPLGNGQQWCSWVHRFDPPQFPPPLTPPPLPQLARTLVYCLCKFCIGSYLLVNWLNSMLFLLVPCGKCLRPDCEQPLHDYPWTHLTLVPPGVQTWNSFSQACQLLYACTVPLFSFLWRVSPSDDCVMRQAAVKLDCFRSMLAYLTPLSRSLLQTDLMVAGIGQKDPAEGADDCSPPPPPPPVSPIHVTVLHMDVLLPVQHERTSCPALYDGFQQVLLVWQR